MDTHSLVEQATGYITDLSKRGTFSGREERLIVYNTFCLWAPVFKLSAQGKGQFYPGIEVDRAASELIITVGIWSA